MTTVKFASVCADLFMDWPEVGEAAQICQFIKNEAMVNVNEFCVNECAHHNCQPARTGVTRRCHIVGGL